MLSSETAQIRRDDLVSRVAADRAERHASESVVRVEVGGDGVAQAGIGEPGMEAAGALLDIVFH